MKRSILLGLLNVLLALLQLTLCFIFYFSAIPNFREIYTEFGTDLDYSFRFVYAAVTLLLVLSIGNFYFGSRLLTKTDEKTTKIAVFYLIISFFFAGALAAAMSSMLVMPLYSLTSKF